MALYRNNYAMHMGKASFISDSDAALADFIWKGIQDDPNLNRLILSRDQFSFSSPKDVKASGSRKLSIFLYNVTAKNETKIMVLQYLVTPFTGNEVGDHALIERIVQSASEAPLINTENDANDAGIRVTLDLFSLDELTKLWTAIGSPLRLCVSLTVTGVQNPSAAGSSSKGVSAVTVIPTQPTLARTERVTQLFTAVLKTFTEQSNGWKKRNMMVRQWTFMDFKKVTEMSVDEMLSSLKDLGDKLEQHGSTDQFIKPLEQLDKYYEYQLGQLKGMQKVSRNQGENLALISGWIKDIKELIEALNPEPISGKQDKPTKPDN